MGQMPTLRACNSCYSVNQVFCLRLFLSHGLFNNAPNDPSNDRSTVEERSRTARDPAPKRRSHVAER